MDAKNLAAITEQLEKERTVLASKADKLRGELTGIEGDLRRITAAIAALNGAEATPSPKKASKAKKDAKRAAGRTDVVKLVRAALSEDPVLEQDELRQRVEEALVRNGYSRLGFALRFKEALADPQFIDSPGGVRLAESKAAVH